MLSIHVDYQFLSPSKVRQKPKQVDRRTTAHSSFTSRMYKTSHMCSRFTFYRGKTQTSLPLQCVHIGTWLKTANSNATYTLCKDCVFLKAKRIARSQIPCLFSASLKLLAREQHTFFFEANKGWRQKFPTWSEVESRVNF